MGGSPIEGDSQRPPRRRCSQLYQGEDGSAHAGVSRALQALRGLADVDPKLSTVLPLIEEAAIQIKEAARELEHYCDSLEVDTARQDEVERRLAAIEELARKHRVPRDRAARTRRTAGRGARERGARRARSRSAA